MNIKMWLCLPLDLPIGPDQISEKDTAGRRSNLNTFIEVATGPPGVIPQVILASPN